MDELVDLLKEQGRNIVIEFDRKVLFYANKSAWLVFRSDNPTNLLYSGDSLTDAIKSLKEG